MEDAPANNAVTQEPSDWVEAHLFSGSMDCPLWGGKFSMCLPLLLPQGACFPWLVILWPKNGPDYPVIILRNSCTYTRFVWKWGSGRPSRRLAWRSVYMSPTRAHTHTCTHTHTQKTIWVVFPVSLLWQTIYTKKEIAFISETLSPCCTNIWTPPYNQVCIIIHPHQHIRMSGLISFFPLNYRLSCRDPDLFEHVHFEWTYWLVPSQVYCSSGVGLGLLLRMEKSLLTEGPHWYVWSKTRLMLVWTLWGGPCAYSSKPWCFWRIFTVWQLWQKPTPTPSPGSWCVALFYWPEGGED